LRRRKKIKTTVRGGGGKEKDWRKPMLITELPNNVSLVPLGLIDERYNS
jgi:hypothetical protein